MKPKLMPRPSPDEELWQEYVAAIPRLRDEVAISKYELDDEVQKQPVLYLEASELYMSCIDRRDYFKEQVVRVSADVAASLRESGEYKTEAAIKEALENSLQVADAKDRFAFWVRKSNICLTLREALDQKGKMLRELVNLYVSGYFQNSAAGAAANKAVTHRHEVVRGKLAEARARRNNA